MDKFKFSTKRIAIDKSSTQTVIAVSIASFIVMFSLVAANSVLNQYHYQARVMKVAKVADVQLNNNITAYNGLTKSYVKFNTQNPNIIGSPVTDTTNNNTQVVLNALPGEYDYPALVTSLYYIFSANGVQGSVSVKNQQADQSTPTATSSQNPQAIQVPFGFSLSSVNASTITSFLTYLKQTTRPISIDSMSITGERGSLDLTLTAHTYYQPAKTFKITNKVVL